MSHAPCEALHHTAFLERKINCFVWHVRHYCSWTVWFLLKERVDVRKAFLHVWHVGHYCSWTIWSLLQERKHAVHSTAQLMYNDISGIRRWMESVYKCPTSKVPLPLLNLSSFERISRCRKANVQWSFRCEEMDGQRALSKLLLISLRKM